MCFSVALTRETIENDPRFHHLLDELYQNPGFKISGFSFPGLPVLRDDFNAKADLIHWGLIPPWVKDDAKAKKIRSGTINARWESLSEKPSFRDSWPGKRCILPVEGFYEPHLEADIKSTWYIRPRDNGLLYLGGIWQENQNLSEDWPSLTFSIITVESRDLLKDIHNEKPRMPLMLSRDAASHWLGNGPSELRDSFWHIDQESLEAWECLPGGREKAPQNKAWVQRELF